MEILLPDLIPGQEYNIQLRSKSQTGTSQWSRAYSFTTDSDITAPSPATGLTWVVSGTSFVAEWVAPTTDSNGGELKDFKDFKVTLTADASDVVFYVTEPRFDLSLSRNISSWGNPEPSVDIKVEVRDNLGNLSTAITDSATNAIPSDVMNFDATSALGGVNLAWDHIADDDLKQYEIYVGGSGGFTPGPSNLKIVTASNAAFYATDILTLQYYKIRAVDAFNQGSSNYTVESQVAYPLDGVPDSTPPSQPSAPTVSTATLVAQVSHAMTKQAGGNLESDVDYLEIHASVSSGFTPSSSTLRGTIDSAGVGIAVSAAFYFPTTDSMTNLYWKVIAVDRSKNKSSASNQTTGLPNLIENVNILNATITDAKVQNLSAAKLIAGTAIINDLFIESNLTVSDAGTIESENFSTGVSGWKIAADGSVEFNDGLFRGDLDISTVYDSKIFSVEIGNMDSNFIWYSEDILTGQEPTVLFQGWSFKEDGIGGFDPAREIQSVMRLTPLGEFQILFDPSHTTDILSVDGNNRRDALGDERIRYYGWVDKRIGMGTENDVSYNSNIEGRDPYSNTYYMDDIAVSRNTSALGSELENSARIQGYADADGSSANYYPRAQVKLRTDSQGTDYSKNIIQDYMDLFDNGGGVSYYNTNTVRNRITLNSIPTNLKIFYSSANGYEKNMTGVDFTLTSAGSGTHSIAFTPSTGTYPIAVTPGDEMYMTFYGYKPGALSLDYRFFMKTNNGVTVYAPQDTFTGGLFSTDLRQNSNYSFDWSDLMIVPAGATSAYFGIEFIGTIASNQICRMSGIQLIKVFSNNGVTRSLESTFDHSLFYNVGGNYSSYGEAEIIVNSTARTTAIKNTTLTKVERNASIEFNVEEADYSSGALGYESSTMELFATGLQLGYNGDPRLPHGEYRQISPAINVPAFTSVKMLFSQNILLDRYDGTTMTSYWDSMGTAMDNTPGYTLFVPQRAGLFLIHFSSTHSPSVGTTNIMYADLVRDATGQIVESGHFDNNSGRDSVTFVTALDVGEKVYIQVTHSDAATKSVFGAASFVQLL